jgi:hypothetical protein
MCGTTDCSIQCLCQQSLPCPLPAVHVPSVSAPLLRAVPSVSLLKPYEPDNWSDSISPAGDLGWVGSMDRQFVSRCNIRRPLWVPVAPFQCRPYIKRAAAISLMSSPRVLATAVQCSSGIWHTAWPCVLCDAYSTQPLFVRSSSISTLCSL